MQRLKLTLWMSLCAPILIVQAQGPGAGRTPPPATIQLKRMPDYCQVDKQLPNGGTQYCAPTAISNILVWLDGNGFPEMIPETESSERTQRDLIKMLGSELYMNTDETTGTSPLDTMIGLERYVRQRGYHVEIEWKGWRDGGRFTAKNRIPSLRWLDAGTQGPSNIIISVGWYTHRRRTNSYKRLGGHYVTVVGLDLKGRKGPTLYIHNPSFGTGQAPRPSTCRLVPLTGGSFEPWGGYKGHSTRGYYQIKDIPMRSDAEVAVLDGGIRFTVLPISETKLASVLPEELPAETEF